MRRSAAYAVFLLVLCSAAWGTEAPVAVSPGDASKLALVEGKCPTFSWGEVEGARSYELVVYRLGEEGEEAKPVLRETFAGSVSGWTPSLDLCLERGGQYAWSVRAVGVHEASDWSAPNLFEVASGPSEVEFEEAVAVVRQYLAGHDEREAATTGGSKFSSETSLGAPAEVPESLAPATTQLTVDGGVEATSFTGDGSPLTNLNPSNLSAAVPVSKGGTGATDAAGARTNLGVAAGAPTVDTDTTCLDAGVACNFAASASVGGAATTGDSATGFFSTGQIEEPRIADAIARDSELAPGSPALAKLVLCLDGNVGGWRYWDLADGTVLDCNTGKIWLKDASCLGTGTWGTSGTEGTVQKKVADLNSGTEFSCSGYTAGTYTDWQVPTISDLCSAGNFSQICPAGNASDSLVDSSVSGSPKVVNAKGDAGWTTNGDAFVGVQSSNYWSATEVDADFAWGVNLDSGVVANVNKGNGFFVMPVRVVP